MTNIKKDLAKKVTILALGLTGFVSNVCGAQDSLSVDSVNTNDSTALYINSLEPIKQIISLEQIPHEEMDSLVLGIYDNNKDGEKDSLTIQKYKTNGIDIIAEYTLVKKDDKFKISGPFVTINGVPNSNPYPYSDFLLKGAPREISERIKNLTRDGTYTINKQGKVIRYQNRTD